VCALWRSQCGRGAELADPCRAAFRLIICVPRHARLIGQINRVIPSRRVADSPGIPESIDGVVRWRACDLIMRLYEEFGLSVSDDTIYRALKKLGFSHVSARPKAYKQNAEAMEAFKKTSPGVWRKSARHLHQAHRYTKSH
jgi:hypothetical protein